MNRHTIIFVGRAGSGKGTQAKLLADALKTHDSETPVAYFEAGSHFRSFTAQNTHTSDLSRAINEQGGLQPLFLAVHMWSAFFLMNLHGNEHLVMDGSPRKVGEADILDSALRFYGRAHPIVIYIDISEDEARKRLVARHRGDDTDDSITRRLAWFEQEVVAVIDHYKTASDYTFIHIDGERSIDEIHQDIASHIIT